MLISPAQLASHNYPDNKVTQQDLFAKLYPQQLSSHKCRPKQPVYSYISVFWFYE